MSYSYLICYSFMIIMENNLYRICPTINLEMIHSNKSREQIFHADLGLNSIVSLCQSVKQTFEPNLNCCFFITISLNITFFESSGYFQSLKVAAKRNETKQKRFKAQQSNQLTLFCLFDALAKSNLSALPRASLYFCFYF